MASFNKFQSFVEALAEGAHDLGSDTLKVALSNTSPSATDTGFAPGGAHPPPSNTNGYTSGGNTPSISDSSQTSGTYKLTLADTIFTASGGSLGPFRYAILYNDTASSDEVIGWWDYGSSITLADGETFTFDADASNGILQLA
jgi:hypothetical protein